MNAHIVMKVERKARNRLNVVIRYFGSERVQTISAAKIPGTHPTSVNRPTIRIVPHPLSSTASGGNNIQSIARPHPM
jgi:hypothetical protein